MLVGIRLLIAFSHYHNLLFNLLFQGFNCYKSDKNNTVICLSIMKFITLFFLENKNIIFIGTKYLIFNDVYKIFMTFFPFHCLLYFYKLEKPIKNQPKNHFWLNDKNLALFDFGSRSRPHAIRYILSR